MAKKKINIKSVTSDVPSGDVNITYKNVRIAGLSESTTAVLETEDTICEDDIEVEYTKSETPATRVLTIHGNDSFEWGFYIPNVYSSEEDQIASYYISANSVNVYHAGANKVRVIVEDVAGAIGSKTHPDNITGDCVISYSKNKVGFNPAGLLILNPNAATFEITIVGTQSK